MTNQNIIQRLLDRSRQLYSEDDIQRAIARMAASINAELAQQDLVILCVMKGGIPFTAALMSRLAQPLQLDYVHATRYGDKLQGGEIHWLAKPTTELANRTVLVADDIYDEGHTLAAIVQYCWQQGAQQVKTAVLVNKLHQRKIAGFNVDYVGLTVPDEYVFGFGMDCEGLGRNLNAIYALQTDE